MVRYVNLVGQITLSGLMEAEDGVLWVMKGGGSGRTVRGSEYDEDTLHEILKLIKRL